MKLLGQALIGGQPVRGAGDSFRAFDPQRGEHIEPPFHSVSEEQVNQACVLAGAAFDAFRASSDAQRATLLEAIAGNILDLGDELIERAMAETGLPRARLEGERARTCNQLKLFAGLLREGSWCDPRIDPAMPQRAPLPRADLRYRLIGVGPVAVFGASNFPLAFSVAGGDTASALAAGCPVVVKAHSAHPGTSELVAHAVVAAVQGCGLPPGVFSLLPGSGSHIGQALVRHPAIQAVGFTGSRAGGTSLMATAAARRQPIPVYAEMSSINPVFLLPAALAARHDALAAGFAASLTLGVGQFCTNPGLVLGLEGPALDRFCAAAAQALGGSAAGTMLTAGIAASYQRGVQALAAQSEVSTLVSTAHTGCQGGPALFRAGAASFLAQESLSDEVFGPAALVIACRDLDEMRRVAEHLEGQLTATLHMNDADMDAAQALLPVLERKAGRIVTNGFPTGVEVAHAMVHGGPFPATSDGRSTSVGSAAIHRFLRAVCYQDLPQPLLPPVLRDANPAKVWRRRDGLLTQE
ncbi:aldehyde dehydrogenase (NADP(+)) [Massilia terrae]|uniref:Aldehyde dehydrogenase (NADP(+)) n=1 Tax=Massilia terrae TaxID=1811224 RepID=A0ABT2CVR2_9BURK|nr:aldehyde dehydrogenase (NADP(+)) [Massilia terrae]MCS0657173.1 aldehyde dehydrogenase (NADP(+)) [Massilia terrae]